MKRLSALGVTCCVALLLVACSTPAPSRPVIYRGAPDVVPWSGGQQAAEGLLNRYGLHPAGGPRVGQECTYTPVINSGDMFEDGFWYSSKGIGLDPAAHAGERVWGLVYTLKEKAGVDEDTMTAMFAVTTQTVVEASLLLGRDFCGGPTTLSNTQWRSRR
jgi:hypothetical protein